MFYDIRTLIECTELDTSQSRSFVHYNTLYMYEYEYLWTKQINKCRFNPYMVISISVSSLNFIVLRTIMV